jgi:hypothetical protein
MDDDQDHICRACDRIDAATKNDDNETVYAALICIFTYRMSLEGCDHFREAIAQHLTESVPEMLANANREAAARKHEGKHTPMRMHH